MDKEKLINQIMKECADEGEPITREDAEQMAEMEINAREINNRGQAEPTTAKKERKPRENKVDPDKHELMDLLDDALCDFADNVADRKADTEINFTYNGAEYTLRLIKHRPKKG